MGRISNSYRASQSYFRHILRERKTLQTAHSTHHGDFFDIWHTTVHPKSPWFMLETVLNRILHNPVSRWSIRMWLKMQWMPINCVISLYIEGRSQHFTGKCLELQEFHEIRKERRMSKVEFFSSFLSLCSCSARFFICHEMSREWRGSVDDSCAHCCRRKLNLSSQHKTRCHLIKWWCTL